MEGSGQGPGQSSAAGQRPSSASLGGRWQHRFFYLTLKYIGLKPAYFVLYFVAFWYTLYPGVRAKSEIYLEQRFGAANFFRSFRRHFRLNHNFAKVLLERAALGILGPEQLKVLPEPYEELLQNINALLTEGRGLILLTAHVGCWQWGLAGLGFVERRANIMQRRDQGDIDLHYFEHQQRNPLRVIDSGDEFGGVLEALNALKNNELVCIMGDRAYHPRQQLELDFLGRRASFPIGAYHLAAQAQAPILILFILGNPDIEGKIECVQSGVLRPVSLPRKRRLPGRATAETNSQSPEPLQSGGVPGSVPGFVESNVTNFIKDNVEGAVEGTIRTEVAQTVRPVPPNSASLASPAGSFGQAEQSEAHGQAGTDKNEMFRSEAEQFVAALEQVCQKHPFQYFNFHNIWI